MANPDPKNHKNLAPYIDGIWHSIAPEELRQKFESGTPAEATSKLADKTSVAFFDSMGTPGYTANSRFWTAPWFWLFTGISLGIASFLGFLGFNKIKQRILDYREHHVLKKLVSIHDKFSGDAYEQSDEKTKKLWPLSFRIYDPATRYQLQWLIAHGYSAQIKAEKLAELIQTQTSPILSYQNHQHLNDSLTGTERFYFGFSVVGSFFKWFIPTLCLAGALLFSSHHLSPGFSFTEFFSNHIAQGFYGLGALLGIGAAIEKARSYRERRQAILQARYEKAEVECKENQERFKYLLELVEDNDNTKKDELRTAWTKISGPSKKTPAHAETQNDFLKGLSITLSHPNQYENFKTRFINTLLEQNELTEPKPEIIQLIDQEAEDFKEKVSITELPKAEKYALAKNAILLGLMWFISVASVPGVNFTHGNSFQALWTTPVGWAIILASAAVGIVLSVPRYFINKRKTLEERREKMQDYLLDFDKEYKLKNFTPESPQAKQWAKINTLNLGERAYWQRKLLRQNFVLTEEEDKEFDEDTSPKNNIEKATAPDFALEMKKYQRLHENKLTNRERLEVFLSTFLLSFFEYGLPVFCVGGLALVPMGTFLILSSPITWPITLGLTLASVVVGSIFIAKNIHQEVETIKKHREERAEKEIAFNNLELENLAKGDFAKDKIKSLWEQIDTWGCNNSTKAEIQRDFLKALPHALAQQKFEDFEKQFSALGTQFKDYAAAHKKEQEKIETDKKRDIPAFNANKYQALQTPNTLTGDERWTVFKGAVSNFARIVLPTGLMGGSIALAGLSLGLFTIFWPIGVAVAGIGLIAGGIYTGYKIYQGRNEILAAREGRNSAATYEIECNNTKKYPSLTQKPNYLALDEALKIKIQGAWEAIGRLVYDNIAKAEIQKDFLEGLNAVIESQGGKYSALHTKKFEAFIAEIMKAPKINVAAVVPQPYVPIVAAVAARENDQPQLAQAPQAALSPRDLPGRGLDLAQGSVPSLPPSAPTYRTPLRKTHSTSSLLSMWTSNTETPVENNLQAHNPNPAPSPRASLKNSDSN